MPNIKSAIKRVKTSDKRRALNASQKLDKAVTKGLIHKNAAARKKSRLAKKLNALTAQA